MRNPQLIVFGAIGIIAILAVLVISGILPGLERTPGAAFSLTIWGFQDDPEIWESIARAYKEKEAPKATIAYVMKPPKTYQVELLNALASGRGPDIFLLKDSELAAYGDKIQPLPEGRLGYRQKNLRNIFADGLRPSLTDKEGSLLGTPLEMDTLALFFNRDYFNSANIASPPQTWEEVAEQTTALTKLSALGSIRRSGAALGLASNVAHASDILLALVYQSGGKIINVEERSSALRSPATQEALAFYTSFANSAKKTYSWNAFFENSLQAFAKGEAAMAFGYARDIPTVAALNPQLNFDVAPLPQPKGAQTKINFGRFTLLVVSRTATAPDNAWRFLLWLQSKSIQKIYTEALGLPPARRDLVNLKPGREYLDPFYDQVLSARAFPLEGGQSLESILDAMIEAVANRRFSIEQAISRAEDEIEELLRLPSPQE